MPHLLVEVSSRAEHGYHVPARFGLDPNTFRDKAVAAIAAMKSSGCSESVFQADDLRIEMEEYAGRNVDRSSRYSRYRDTDDMEWRPFVRIYDTGNFDIEFRSGEYRVVADGAAQLFEPPIDPTSIASLANASELRSAVVALQIAAKTDLDERPTQQDYGDPVSAYDNGREVALSEAGIVAAAALQAMRIPLTPPTVAALQNAVEAMTSADVADEPESAPESTS